MFRNLDGFSMGRGTLESLGEPLRLGIFHHGKDRGDFPLRGGLIGLIVLRHALSSFCIAYRDFPRGRDRVCAISRISTIFATYIPKGDEW